MQQMRSLGAAFRRDRVILLAGIACGVVLSWGYLAYLVWQARGMHMAMSLGQAWKPVDFFFVFLMWSIMMIAMMIPSAAPMILMFATISRTRRQRRQPFVPTGIFASGYLGVWAGFSAFATAAQWLFHQAALFSSQDGRMGSVPPGLGAVLLIMAGLFQWTSLKEACLHHCRTPLGFLMTEWREGYRGAFGMGIKHGAVCLGCCWFLMSLMFVGGVMNPLWMVLITIYILLEKVIPAGLWVGRVAGLFLIGWGLWMLVMRLN